MSSNDNILAFEYVIGTLRDSARTEFDKRIQQEPDLLQQVNYWEQELLLMQDLSEQRPLAEDIWPQIQKRITKVTRRKSVSWWNPIALVATLLVTVLVAVLFVSSSDFNNEFPVDYVAVLLDEQGEPQLTAITQGDNRKLLLQWEALTLKEQQSLQLWAESRSDGQIRSLAIIQQTDLKSLSLSEANWRLIKDAKKLILSVEESGGSPIDEPSEQIIARGVCVRVSS